MDDEEAIEWARKSGAKVAEYSQTEGLCIATTADWIRKASKGKTIFDKTKLTFIAGERWGLAQPTQVVGTRNVQDQKSYFTKLSDMQGSFKSSHAQEVEYVEKGHFCNNKKMDKAKIPRNVECIERMKFFVYEKATGFVDAFRLIGNKKCLASIGYFSGDIAHAVGIDCSNGDGSVKFFDAIIGEFSFESLDNFILWWLKCWNDRANVDPRMGESGKSAWHSISLRQAGADLYKPVSVVK